MANPQLENGFIPVPNEVGEALALAHLWPYEFKILWFILRKTLGWRKESDFIPLSQIALGTGIPKPHCSRALNSLIRRDIVARHDNGKLSLNKNYSLWQLQRLPRTVTPQREKRLPRTVTGVTQDGNKRLPRTVTSTDNTDTYSTDTANPLLLELRKLTGWDSRNDESWLTELLEDYPRFCALHVRACRDWWSGRPPKGAPNWRSRLRNWMKKDSEKRGSGRISFE